jgi:2-oxoglutarate dehydrogenase E1 component
VAENGLDGVALVRVEQLAPFPLQHVQDVLARFPSREHLVWCQEEPSNMGAWTFVRNRLPFTGYAGRRAAGSPATGVTLVHKAEQAALVRNAVGITG